jgi:hypothetical protein
VEPSSQSGEALVSLSLAGPLWRRDGASVAPAGSDSDHEGDNEYAARNAAAIAWIQAAFAEARDRDSAAVMAIGEDDPGFDTSDATRAPLRDPKTLAETDGYQAFLTELRSQTITFRRPVVYVHGDSHYFRIDKPLLDESGRRLENFTRVETFGDNAGNGNTTCTG